MLYIGMDGITLPMCMPAHWKRPHYALPHALQIAIHRSRVYCIWIGGMKKVKHETFI
jgi:hypothetical protein